jgi:hypothetical protein
VLVEPPIEVLLGFLDLVEDQFQGRFHGAKGSTESGKVIVVDLVGFQREESVEGSGFGSRKG